MHKKMLTKQLSALSNVYNFNIIILEFLGAWNFNSFLHGVNDLFKVASWGSFKNWREKKMEKHWKQIFS